MELGAAVGAELPFSHPRAAAKDGDEDVACIV